MNKKVRYIVLLFLTVNLQVIPAPLNELLHDIHSAQNDAINSGAVILLMDKERVLLNVHTGKPNWNDKATLSNDHMFRIGSISKSFAAVLAMRMQQAGKLDIRLPFNHYVRKTFINNSFSDAPITIEQLMEHTAGLAGLSTAEWSYNESNELSVEQTLLLKKGNHKTHWQPGLHHSYTNAGYGLLGLVLEKAGGKSYEALMDEYVFAPLGMGSSTLLLDKKTEARLMTGYDTDGKKKIPYWHNIYRPFAAVNTDAKDMIRFLQMLLNFGELKDKGSNNDAFLTRESIDRIETPKTSLASVDKLSYGYALANYSWQRDGYTFRGHGGDADGYLSRYGYNRESGLAYFVMVNAFNYKPIGKLRRLLENYIIKDLPINESTNMASPDPSNIDLIKDFTGNYISVTSRFGKSKRGKKSGEKLSITKIGKKLYLKIGNGSSIRIHPVTKNHFRYFDETVATFAFIRYDGELYLQGDMGNFRKIIMP
ncbi:MAG: beta-lactamase family protein [Kangiellaceae bacterium]|nr:beta-lactamase family protein [Kangiellaceae bacterium]